MAETHHRLSWDGDGSPDLVVKIGDMVIFVRRDLRSQCLGSARTRVVRERYGSHSIREALCGGLRLDLYGVT